MAAKLAIEAFATKGLLSDIENGKQTATKRKKKKNALDRLIKKAGISPPVFLPAVQDPLSDRWKVSCKLTFRAEVSPGLESKEAASQEEVFHGIGESEARAREHVVRLVKNALSKKGLVPDAPQANLKAKLQRIIQLSGLPKALFPPPTQAGLGSPWQAICKLAFSEDVSPVPGASSRVHCYRYGSIRLHVRRKPRSESKSG